jgi:hypothetical protein
MDYLLERKVKINTEPEYKSLYSWCLNEFDDNDKLIGSDLVPFAWRFWFTGTSLQVITKLEVERDFETDKTKTSTTKTIRGKFYSGICFDGKNITDEVVFSIFGTARTVKEFSVSISEAKSDKEEVCWFTAIPSYESEGAEFQKEIENDYVGFDIYVHSEKFNELVKLVESCSLNSVSFSVKGVDGLYARWTPTIKTYTAKILTSDNAIEGVDEFDTSLSDTEQRLVDFNKNVSDAFVSTIASFTEGFAEIIGRFAAGGGSLTNIGNLILSLYFILEDSSIGSNSTLYFSIIFLY